MMSEWCMSKFLAWEEQGGICPICQCRIYLTDKQPGTRLVGHHKVSRQYGDNSVENCEARHEECENWAHWQWKDGNPK